MAVDYARDFFKSHNGLIYFYETGHRLKITCTEVPATPQRPMGLKYSLALFDPANRCLVRFDNSHKVSLKGKPSPVAFDHWHRFGKGGKAVPYRFVSVEKLLTDFFSAVDRHLPVHLKSS